MAYFLWQEAASTRETIVIGLVEGLDLSRCDHREKSISYPVVLFHYSMYIIICQIIEKKYYHIIRTLLIFTAILVLCITRYIILITFRRYRKVMLVLSLKENLVELIRNLGLLGLFISGVLLIAASAHYVLTSGYKAALRRPYTGRGVVYAGLIGLVLIFGSSLEWWGYLGGAIALLGVP